MLVEWFDENTLLVTRMDSALEQIVSVVVAAGSRNFVDSAVRVETSGLQREERRLALEVSIKKTGQQVFSSSGWTLTSNLRMRYQTLHHQWHPERFKSSTSDDSV